jgi:hypothetical protein
LVSVLSRRATPRRSVLVAVPVVRPSSASTLVPFVLAEVGQPRSCAWDVQGHAGTPMD